MDLTLREYVFMLGAALFVGGFFALAVPVTARDELTFGNVDCGYGFSVTNEDRLTPRGLADCEDAVSGRQAWAWPLLIGGLAVALGGFAVPKRSQESPTDTTS